MTPRMLLAPAFQDVLPRQANLTRLSTYLATEITLQPKPFSRLGIWAYIAFAFIVLAVSTVIGYMTYTCCYSAKRRCYGADRASRRIGAVRLNSTKRSGIHWMRGGKYQFGEKGKVVQGQRIRTDLTDKIGSGSESPWVQKTIVEMRKLAFTHRRTPSESQENIAQYQSSTSNNSLGTHITDHPFEADDPCISSPPLAHTSERAATYIPFHLPPPPSSPTPTYKEFLERQKLQYYRGKDTSSYSPASPSPALFNSPPPDLSTSSALSKPQRPPKNEARRKAAATSNSNNIRVVPQINPFATPSTRIRWDDPKLSPITSTIIANPPASALQDYFSSQVASDVRQKSEGAHSPNGKTVRLLSPHQSDEPGGHGYERDNFHPISRVHFVQGNAPRDNRF